jgi:hypothetical protein
MIRSVRLPSRQIPYSMHVSVGSELTLLYGFSGWVPVCHALDLTGKGPLRIKHRKVSVPDQVHARFRDRWTRTPHSATRSIATVRRSDGACTCARPNPPTPAVVDGDGDGSGPAIIAAFLLGWFWSWRRPVAVSRSWHGSGCGSSVQCRCRVHWWRPRSGGRAL